MSSSAIMKHLLRLLLLVCVATAARAQDNLDSRGIAAFGETCLMPDPRFEKIYEWATARELKLLDGVAGQSGRAFSWEIAASGLSSIHLIVHASYQLPRHRLYCAIWFRNFRDADKRVEAFFLDVMKRRPDAKPERRPGRDPSSHYFVDGDEHLILHHGTMGDQQQTPSILLALNATQAPPDVAPPMPAFATAERSYKHFVDYCMALFPDIPGIAKRMDTTGWKRGSADRGGKVYMQHWILFDPFNVMAGYGIELMQMQPQASCGLSFDLRGAVPMERLIRDYGLKRESSPYPEPTGLPPEYAFEHYSAVVAGNRLLFQLMTNSKTRSGQLTVSSDLRR